MQCCNNSTPCQVVATFAIPVVVGEVYSEFELQILSGELILSLAAKPRRRVTAIIMVFSPYVHVHVLMCTCPH